jgi:acyl dehydratase
MAANKRVGKKSLAQNDYLAPSAPLIGSGTDVGSGRAYNNGAVSVAFTHQGPYAATSYTVTASTGQTATGGSSPIVVSGIATGATPTFTVTATNGAGTSAASSASGAVTVTTVPAAPTSVTASSPGGANYDTVSWTAPANGGKAITNYYVTSSDGKTANTASTSVNVTQEQGTAQTYTVYADNSNGRSAASAPSNSVTTFSFVPFSVFSFFGVFGFGPFGVFSFGPFGVFGFR